MTTATLPQKPSIREAGKFAGNGIALSVLREAVGGGIDEKLRTAQCIIISEGLGNLRDKNYYTADAVKSAAVTFESKQFYIDHPGESEEQDRPERSIRDLAGYFSDCKVGQTKDADTGETLTACLATLHFSESEAGQLAFAQVKTALQYQKRYPTGKDVYAGISINGGGVSHPGTIKGMQVNMVTEIQEAFSADIVTKPARGGRFVALMHEAARVAAWKRRVTLEGDRLQTQTGSGGKRMPLVGEKQKVKETAIALRKKQLTDVRRLTKEVKALEVKIEDADHLDEAAATATGKKMASLGEKVGKLRAAAAVPEGDLASMIMDLQQDLGELSKSLGMGGGADDAAGTNPTGEDAQDTGMGGGLPTLGDDETTAEDDGAGDDDAAAEAEGEGEKESETGKETTEGADETEKEAEGEGEKESEDDAEEEADPAPGAGDKGAGNMQFKCSKCGETNVVAPPQGMRLVAAESKRTSESDAIKALRSRLERATRTLEMKEGRFVQTNHKVAKLLKENIGLKAENLAYKRMAEAKRLLKEANIPRDILKAETLVTLYEPEQWGAAIESARNMLDREARLVGKGGNRQREGKGGDVEVSAGDPLKVFNEAYKAGEK